MHKNLTVQIGNREFSILNIGAGALKYPQQATDFLRPNLPEKTLITIGSISKLPRDGNTGGNFYFQGKPLGLSFDINKFGLPNVGIDAMRQFLLDFTQKAHAQDCLVGVNVVGFCSEDFVSVIHILIQLNIDYIEINAGCANAIGAEGKRKEVLFYNLPLLDETLSAVNKIIKHIPKEDRPVFALKGSLVPQENLIRNTIEVLKKHSYLDALVMINTVANTTYYNENQELVIGIDGMGGLSGPAIFPIALGQIYMWKQHLTDMKCDLAITGIGGIRNGGDIQAMLNAGAANVQIVSHFNNNGCDPGVIPQMLAEYMDI